MSHFVVRLAGFGPGKYVVRGNAYPPAIARYATREQAQAIADQCPDNYRAIVEEVE